MSNLLRRAWAEISLDNIAENFKIIKSKLNDSCLIMSVVKADAYGHGVEKIAPFFDKLGTDWFAVSNIEEAIQLRQLGIKKPVLILGYTPPECAAELHQYDISQALISSEYAYQLSKCCVDANVSVKVHIKIDTGMSRVGFYYHNTADGVDEIYSAAIQKGLVAEGIFTHFATSDYCNDEQSEHTDRQFELFCSAVEKLEASGLTLKIKHCANSAATLTRKNMQLSMVRPGIILYGLEPSEYFRDKYGLKAAMTFKAAVSCVKEINAGDCVSYGRTFCAESVRRIATVSVGYADGYPRYLSNCGTVTVKGKPAPVIGKVCMDQMMIDVTDIKDVKQGDEVILFGEGGITVEEYADKYNTINYEAVCSISSRVTRVYKQKDKPDSLVNYILKQID